MQVRTVSITLSFLLSIDITNRKPKKKGSPKPDPFCSIYYKNPRDQLKDMEQKESGFGELCFLGFHKELTRVIRENILGIDNKNDSCYKARNLQ